MGMLKSVALGAAWWAAAVAAGPIWPGWRGDGSGRSDEADVPRYWDREKGIAWRVRLPGEGNSSPVVWHDRVFLTASAEDGLTRLILCFDAESGRSLWQVKINGDRTKTHPKAGRAAATPVSDGERVYAYFDSPGLVAADHNGSVLWTRHLGPFKNPYNMAGSPVLCDDLIVQNCDHRGASFIAAFDRTTGAERWRTGRQGGLHYATPLVITHEGVRQIVVNGETIVSYDARTGTPLWSCRGMKHATTPTALYHDGLVYVTCGRNGPSMAIDPGGRGDVTETHVRMHISSGGPYVPSPLILDNLFVLPGDNGRLLFADLEGRIVYRYQVPADTRKFTASPVLGGGFIYWPDDSGRTHVLRVAGLRSQRPAVEAIAANPLAEPISASPAVASARLYLRTAKHLYCVAGGEARTALPQPPELPDNPAALSSLYDAEPKGEFDNTNLRLAIVVKAATFDDQAAIDLLAAAALEDGHWDVGEEAIRALGRYGERAVPVLLRMFDRQQPFLKTIAAAHLAAIKPVEATDTLVAHAHADQLQVRIGCIRALGEIAAAHPDAAPAIIPAFIRLAGDDEGLVRRAAVDGLARLPHGPGTVPSAVLTTLRRALRDSNPLVVKAAARALQQQDAGAAP